MHILEIFGVLQSLRRPMDKKIVMGFTVLVRADSRVVKEEKKGWKTNPKVICGGKEMDKITITGR